MSDEETIRVYNEQADDYTKRFATDEPSNSLKSFMSLLSPGAHVLDWGCGSATSSFHMREAGFIPDAMDASTEMVAVAKEQYGLNARLGNFTDKLPKQFYHGVWANFSLLHASREAFPIHLQQIHKALLHEGILHIGLKRGAGEKRDKLGRYYTFYKTEELKRYLQTVGFKILDIQEGEEAGLAGSVDPFVLVLSQKI